MKKEIDTSKELLLDSLHVAPKGATCGISFIFI